MSRLLLTFALALFAASADAATHFWISPYGSALGSLGNTPPANFAAVPTFYNFVTQPSGSFYIWAKPDSGDTLKNWSLELYSSDASILNFTTSTIYNPNLGGSNTRWEYTFNPSPSELMGFTLATNTGLGISAATATNDPYYFGPMNGSGAWLMAKVDYTLMNNIGISDVYLQIGRLGMNNVGENSGQTQVLFGHVGDTPFGSAASINRQSIGSNLLDAKVQVLATPDADFNQDLIADGRDFLIWQRWAYTSNSLNSRGNANGDSVVNEIDLAAWEFQYGSPVAPGGMVIPVPEPTAFALTCAMVLALVARRGRRGDV